MVEASHFGSLHASDRVYVFLGQDIVSLENLGDDERTVNRSTPKTASTKQSQVEASKNPDFKNPDGFSCQSAWPCSLRRQGTFLEMQCVLLMSLDISLFKNAKRKVPSTKGNVFRKLPLVIKCNAIGYLSMPNLAIVQSNLATWKPQKKKSNELESFRRREIVPQSGQKWKPPIDWRNWKVSKNIGIAESFQVCGQVLKLPKKPWNQASTIPGSPLVEACLKSKNTK